MQVIHELRNGVKLRKVCETQELLLRRHIEYELTPFEILLDQIRARRYHLRKVSVSNAEKIIIISIKWTKFFILNSWTIQLDLRLKKTLVILSLIL